MSKKRREIEEQQSFVEQKRRAVMMEEVGGGRRGDGVDEEADLDADVARPRREVALAQLHDHGHVVAVDARGR